MEQQMKECESVSVHIRRAITTPANQALFGGICDLDYYRRAVAEIRKKPDVKFFLFSNDMEVDEGAFLRFGICPGGGKQRAGGESRICT